MARKRVVSRTIKAVDVTIMGVEVESAEVVNKSFTITHKCNRAEALKEAKNRFDTDGYAVVSVVDMHENVYRAEMDEEVFLAAAKVTPIDAE